MRRSMKILSLVFLFLIAYSGVAFAISMGSTDFLNPDPLDGVAATLYWQYDDAGRWEVQLENVNFRPGGLPNAENINKLIIPIGDPTPPDYFTVDETTTTAITSDTALWDTGAYDILYEVSDNNPYRPGTWVVEFTFGPMVPLPPFGILGPQGLAPGALSPIISWDTSFTASSGLLTLVDGGGQIDMDSLAPVGDSNDSGGTVPEPSTLLLLGLGLLGVGLHRKMRTGKVSKK